MEELTPHERDEHGAGMRRRTFIGAGLAGAGAVLIGPGAGPGAAAAAAPGPTATAAQQATTTPSPPAPGPVGDAEIGQLPIRQTYPDLPAIPQDPAGTGPTLARLEPRAIQVTQAKQSLTHGYTLGGESRSAYAFLFGADATPRTLEHPEQFSMGWTTVPNVYRDGLASLPQWAASLTDADAATRQFWPMIAEHGLGYNLIVPERVTPQRAAQLQPTFAAIWARELRAPAAAGALYAIDMSRFASLRPQTVHGAPRFTPSTVTLLTRDRRTGALTPVAISVAGHEGAGATVFTRSGATDGAWLYALQAAKVSITVFGIWLGHVYHWHLVTTAMQMTMFNTLPAEHPVRRLLAPQSKYAIGFDEVLLQLWPDIAPPTSLATSDAFLALADEYGAGRSFFDDDPKATLARFGLREADFTAMTAWDRYPVVRHLLSVWELVEAYVTAYVGATYASDAAVAGDAALATWIATSGAPDGGNVRGLPAMRSRAALISVLTSLLFRVTVHGVSRLTSTSNPALTFVANYPHCLQRTDIPSPRTRIDTRTLLTYLPNTATIAEALSFYYTFTFSTPYEPLIPVDGPGGDLFFPGGPGDPRNQALIALRKGLRAFMNAYQPDAPQHYQWPRNIET
jgi:hypothetical protein